MNNPIQALYDRYDELWTELQTSGSNTNKLAKQLTALSDQIAEAEYNLQNWNDNAA